MTATRQGYNPKQHEIIVRLNSSDAKHKRIERIALVIALLFSILILLISNILQDTKETGNRSDIGFLCLILLILLVCVIIFHEAIHFIPLWIFSKNRPKVGCFFVILLPNTHVSRIQGVKCYLLPFFVISMALIIMAFFVSSSFRVVLTIFLVLHLAGCYSDFLDSFILIKCRGNNIRLAHEKHKNSFDTIFYRDKPICNKERE